MIRSVLRSRLESDAWPFLVTVGFITGLLVSAPAVRATVVSTLTIVLVTLAILWTIATLNDIEPLYIGAIFGFLLLVFTINIPVQEITLSPDAFRYENKAWLTAQSWWLPDRPPVEYLNLRVRAYATVSAGIYFLFGRSPMSLIVTNISFWTFAILCWMIIAKNHLGLSRYGLVGLLLALFPAGMRYSINVVREPLTYAFLALSFLFVFRWVESERARYIVSSAVSSLGLLLLRPELFLPFWVVVSGIALVTGPWNCRKHLLYTVFLGVGIGSLFLRRILRNLPRYANPDYALDVRVLEVKRSSPAGSRTYLEEAAYTSWADVFAYIPVRLYNFTITPLQFVPDQWSLISKQGFDAVFVILVVVLSMLGLVLLFVRWASVEFDAHQIRVSCILVLYYVAVAIGYSLVISSPAAVRRRSVIVPILAVFAAIGLAALVEPLTRRVDIRARRTE